MRPGSSPSGGRPAVEAHRPGGLFVTGTDTGVGKTRVAEAILRWAVGLGLRPGAYKPVASGVSRPGGTAPEDDPRRLWEAAGRPLSPEAVCPQAFSAAAAPAAAARAEGRTVDERLLRDGFACWRAAAEWIVVEGAGGLYSPLSAESLSADLAREFQLPLVVVDGGRLGAVGRVLATLRAAEADGLVVAAVVLSVADPSAAIAAGPADAPGHVLAEARHDLGKRLCDGGNSGGSPPLLVLGHGAAAFDPAVDWIQLAKAAARDSKGI
jgi:dethiobiotin synthetase